MKTLALPQLKTKPPKHHPLPKSLHEAAGLLKKNILISSSIIEKSDANGLRIKNHDD